MMKNLMVVVLLLVLGAGGFVAWEAMHFLNYRGSYGPDSQGFEAKEERILVDVPPGRSFKAVSEELYQMGLINNPFYFRLFARFTVGNRNLKVGEYELTRSMGPREILKMISSGHSFARSVTIPEGANMYDVAEALESKGLGRREDFLRLFKDPQLIRSLLGERVYSLEGYLFPETYNFTKYTGQKEIVAAMVKNFLFVYNQLRAGASTRFTRHQVVTMASVIEKETGAPEERPLIGSVFHNRLRRPMRLQSDPTILYGILDQTGVMKKNITKNDLLAFNRYNTYRIDGLPFGPICNPGKESLAAVFHPADSDYLFFVSRNDGTHFFSSDLKKHNEAVRRFQLDSKARQGKSWRDLHHREKR
jgi:UPF0755 protein